MLEKLNHVNKDIKEDMSNLHIAALSLVEEAIKNIQEALNAKSQEELQKVMSKVTGQDGVPEYKKTTDAHIGILMHDGYLPDVDILGTDGTPIKDKILKSPGIKATEKEIEEYGKALQKFLVENKDNHIRYVYTYDGMNDDQSSGYIHTLENGRMVIRIVTTENFKAHEMDESQRAIKLRNERTQNKEQETEMHVTNVDTKNAHNQLELPPERKKKK